MRTLAFIIFLSISSVTFADTATFECNYSSYSDESGNHPVNNEFTLTFIIDEDNSKAYAVGNGGSTEVIFMPGENGQLSFLELTNTGNVMTTAITESLESVHSRNTVMFGDLIPTQYYGQCEVK